jgi:signal transduction histidine kinase
MNSKPDNRVVGRVVAAIAGALIVGAWALTSVVGVDSSLDEAAALRAIDLSVSTQDLARSAVGQTVLISDAVAHGGAADGDIDVAVDTSTATIADAALRFEQIPVDIRAQHEDGFTTWQALAEQTVAAAVDGDPELAADTMTGSFALTADLLAADLLTERDRLAESIADAKSVAGGLARILGFAVVFVLPLAAIVAYRIAAQRRLSTAIDLLDARVEAEATSGSEQELADFAAELEKPLASIHEYSALLLGGTAGDHDRDLLRLINDRATELAGRVDDVRVAAGGPVLDQIDARELEMGQLIDSVVATFSDCSIGGTHGEGTAIGDEGRVRQILRNLIDNAIRHGGPDVRIYGDPAGSTYVVAVEDNGPGLSDDMAAAFESSSPAMGEGLGLGVVKRLAGAMGGSVDYDRMAGRTSFVLSLPLAAAPAMDEAPLIGAELG